MELPIFYLHTYKQWKDKINDHNTVPFREYLIEW